MQLQAPIAYSAKVRLCLSAAGQMVPLSQVAPTFCISRQPIDLLPQEAEIFVDIDNNRRVHRVFLPDGMSSKSPVTAIRQTGE